MSLCKVGSANINMAEVGTDQQLLVKRLYVEFQEIP
jgi:hypothetical protein